MTISELFLWLIEEGVELSLKPDGAEIVIEAKKRHGLREFREEIKTEADYIAMGKGDAGSYLTKELLFRIRSEVNRQPQSNNDKD